MECIKGNWYKSKFGNYFKCRVNCHSPRFYHSEAIRPWRVAGGWVLDDDDFSYNNLECEISIDEIQEFLPHDHPDKIKININEDTKYLIPILNKIL